MKLSKQILNGLWPPQRGYSWKRYLVPGAGYYYQLAPSRAREGYRGDSIHVWWEHGLFFAQTIFDGDVGYETDGQVLRYVLRRCARAYKKYLKHARMGQDLLPREEKQ